MVFQSIPIAVPIVCRLRRKLLREGQLSVAEIAAKIGYINPNKFTSAFCSEYKMTPTEYKKDVQMDRK